MVIYLQDLFTTTPKEQLNRDEILMILDLVGNDPEIFDPGKMDEFKEMRTAEEA